MSARSLVQEGRKLASAGQSQAALARFQTAVSQRAGFAPALLGAAEVHLSVGQTQEARRILRTIDTWTEDGDALAKAADHLLQLRCEVEAEQATTRALNAGCTNKVGVHRVRGEARRILRRLEEALADFERAAAGDDEFAKVRRSTVLRELGRIDEASLHKPEPKDLRIPAAKAAAWHEKAVQADKSGEAESAFQSWSEAGRIESELPAWRRLDRTLWPRHVASWTTWCQETTTIKEPAPVGKPTPPHFLVGFSRTGTTLLERMLSGHSSIGTSREVPLVTTIRQRLLQGQPPERLPHIVPDSNSSQAEQLRKLFDNAAKNMVPDTASAPCFIHKQPMNAIDLPMILQLWPNAVVIRTVRDPRDVVLSCFAQHFAPNGINRHFLSANDAASMLASVLELNEAIAARFPKANIIDVHYESLVKDPEPTLRHILDRLDLEFEAAVLDPSRDSGIQNTPSFLEAKKAVHPGRTERWRTYKEQLREPCKILDPWITKGNWPKWDHEQSL